MRWKTKNMPKSVMAFHNQAFQSLPALFHKAMPFLWKRWSGIKHPLLCKPVGCFSALLLTGKSQLCSVLWPSARLCSSGYLLRDDISNSNTAKKRHLSWLQSNPSAFCTATLLFFVLFSLLALCSAKHKLGGDWRFINTLNVLFMHVHLLVRDAKSHFE